MHLITGCVLNSITVSQFLVTSVWNNGSNTGFKSGYLGAMNILTASLDKSHINK